MSTLAKASSIGWVGRRCSLDEMVLVGEESGLSSEVGCSDVAGVGAPAVLDFGVLVVGDVQCPSGVYVYPGFEEVVEVVEV